MNDLAKFVLFSIDNKNFALSLDFVDRIVRVCKIIPLPDAPDIIIGVINFHGEILPVGDIRKRLKMPVREFSVEDQLILAQTTKRKIALLVNSTSDVIEYSNEQIKLSRKELHGSESIKGIIKMESGLILIYDLELFLSVEEENKLDTSLKKLSND